MCVKINIENEFINRVDLSDKNEDEQDAWIMAVLEGNPDYDIFIE